MRRSAVPRIAGIALAALTLAACNGQATTTNDVKPSPSGGASISVSPGPRSSAAVVSPTPSR